MQDFLWFSGFLNLDFNAREYGHFPNIHGFYWFITLFFNASGVFCHNSGKPMLSLDRIRKIGPEASRMPENELEELRTALYEFAQLSFDVWWAQKNGSKNPVGLLAPLPKEGKIGICKKKRKSKTRE